VIIYQLIVHLLVIVPQNKVELTSIIFVCRVLCGIGTDWYVLVLLRTVSLLKSLLDNIREYIVEE